MKNFKMLILFAAIIVAISACNTENPITSDNEGNNTTVNPNLPMDPMSNWNCDWYQRDKENGGPKGYSIVIEDRGIFGVIIYCGNPGTTICPSRVMNPNPEYGQPSDDMLNASSHAYSQITSGVLTGFEIFPSSGLSVRWSATSPDTTLSTTHVKVWETSGTEPNPIQN